MTDLEWEISVIIARGISEATPKQATGAAKEIFKLIAQGPGKGGVTLCRPTLPPLHEILLYDDIQKGTTQAKRIWPDTLSKLHPREIAILLCLRQAPRRKKWISEAIGDDSVSVTEACLRLLQDGSLIDEGGRGFYLLPMGESLVSHTRTREIY